MVKRAQKLVFAGGAWVFPGGRVDPDDQALARALGCASDDLAGRIAAVRETIEEAGVAVAVEPVPDPASTRRLRRDLAAGQPLGSAIERSGYALDPGRLIPFARWCPRHPTTRIYDTRFYIADVGAAGDDAEPDGTETVGAAWITAAAALRSDDACGRRMIFPTRRILERLARFATFTDASADAERRPSRTVTPWIEERGGVAYLCIDTDLGYPVTAEPLSDVRRG